MAKYAQLTPEQESSLEYLSNRLANIRRGNYSEEIRKQLVDDVRAKVDEVYSAQETFEKCIKLATYFVAKAEELKKEYGLTWQKN